MSPGTSRFGFTSLNQAGTSTARAQERAMHKSPPSFSAFAVLRRGFTLVELLVVIGIIALLISILLPSLQKSREQAVKVQCASNMRQWGQGLAMYVGANKGFYPHNGRAIPPQYPAYGHDLGWTNSITQQFFEDYLVKNKAVAERQTDNVLYCPTQDWHRMSQNDPTGTGGLVGYFVLFGRESAVSYPKNFDGSANPNAMVYNPSLFPDGREWVEKKKPGGKYKHAPILGDMLQYETGTKSWAGYSNHLRRDVPTGGNFLFEDGHVTWYPQATNPDRPNFWNIDLGATLGTWRCYYRIYDPNIPNNK